MNNPEFVINGESTTLLDVLTEGKATIIKPADKDVIKEEYDLVLDFFVRSFRGMVNQYGIDEAEQNFNVYKTSVIAIGENAVDVMLIGPPDNDIAVLLNKYSVLAETVPLLPVIMFTEEEVMGALSNK